MSPTERFGYGTALALGVIVRVIPVLGAAAAVGDGGLIYAMVEDLRSNGFAIPAVTSYNALDIPFVYPPAALLTAAGLGEATGASTLDLLRWIPVVLSTLTLAAFAWVARRVLPPAPALGATLMYALMPHAYDWVIAGGGLTRGMGLLFALLAIGVAARRTEGSLASAAVAGALLGGSLLSHPQAAIFGVVGCLVVSWGPPLRAWLLRAVTGAAVAAALVVPWLLMVSATHGIDALLSAGTRFEPGIGLIRMLNLRFSGALFMDLFAVLGVVGVLDTVARGPRWIPLLLLLTYLAGAGGGEFLAAVPWALVGGVGLHALFELAAPLYQRRRPLPLGAVAVAAVALFLALIGTLGSSADSSSKLQAMSADQIVAMQWLSENTSPEARVIVPTDDVWGDDEVSEWLPALGKRQSIGTVQGSEWLGRDAFERRLDTHERLRSCVRATVTCLSVIDPGALVFVPKGRLAGLFSPSDCCPALRETLEAGGYRILYDGPGATIAAPEAAQEGD